MGNLPCCNPEEAHKTSALSSTNNPKGAYVGTGHSNALHNQHHNFPSDHQKSSGIPGSDPHSNQLHNSSNNANDPNASHVNSIQFEEQQRALLQEQERLERIVNDAGRDMVHVNGGIGLRGGANGMVIGGGYYDANYAAEVWQHLIPGTGRGGGGLTARCRDFEDEVDPSLTVLNHVPKGALRDGQHVLEVMRSNGEEMELLMKDDQAERFLASVFQEEDGFQDFGAGLLPIVEYVL